MHVFVCCIITFSFVRFFVVVVVVIFLLSSLITFSLSILFCAYISLHFLRLRLSQPLILFSFFDLLLLFYNTLIALWLSKFLFFFFSSQINVLTFHGLMDIQFTETRFRKGFQFFFSSKILSHSPNRT